MLKLSDFDPPLVLDLETKDWSDPILKLTDVDPPDFPHNYEKMAYP